MRIAAGILMIIGGTALLAYYVPLLLAVNTRFHLLLFIPSTFIFSGGAFCLEGKYWKLCFAAALLAVLIMIYWIYVVTFGFSLLPASAWWIWFPIITGAPPIIFVCIRKREWQEISA